MVMAARRRIAIVSFAALVAVAASAEANAAQTRLRGLVPFQNCNTLLSYAKTHASGFVSPYGVGVSTGSTGVSSRLLTPSVAAAGVAGASSSSSTPVQGVDYSGTNDQEQSVDEPDLVKTDGNTLYAVENGMLESVDVSGSTPKLLDTVQLSGGWSYQLLLSGSHLLVLAHGGYWLTPLPAQPASMIVPVSQSSILTEYDVSNPSAMQQIGQLTLNGEYVDARMVGSTVRIVSSSSLPIALPIETPQSSTSSALATAKAANGTVVAHSKISSWLPTYHVKNGPNRPVVQCRNVMRPIGFSGLGMLDVLTVNLAASGLAPVDSTAIMTDGRIVYASPTSLYVATERWAYRPLPSDPTQPPVSDVTTQINAFDISDPTKTTYEGSVTVPGYLLDQFSMSDFQGILRVVSTDSPSWWGNASTSQSYLTTFKVSDGGLTQDGQLSGLGQGEKVYAVRMIGDVGYVETFRQVDPLYTIDLSNPATPRVVGQVDLPGYSAYLQPIGNDLLLGVGQDVDSQTNEPSGTQISLFDVSNLANPRQLAHYSLGQGSSLAESDHHALLFWPAAGLLVIPFNDTAVGFEVSRAGGIQQLGTIVNNANGGQSPGSIDRAVVIRSGVLTVSSNGIETSSLASLAGQSWLSFPAPPPVPVPLPSPLPSPKPITPAVGAASDGAVGVR
jgi:uncharacterized secreted protein with C-terminal beta-propeller domain